MGWQQKEREKGDATNFRERPLQQKNQIPNYFLNMRMQLQTTNTYSRTFSMTPVTPVFTLLISPLPHLLFMLQLLHKIIYVPRLPSILFPRSLLLLLQCAWKSFRTKYTYYLRTIWISAISILTFLSESFPLAAKGGGMKDGTYLQKSYFDKLPCFHNTPSVF